MSETRSLNGLKFNVIQTAENGVVDRNTKFVFSQTGSRIYADYAGGAILDGRLVGIRIDNKMRFCYCQLQADGQLDHGVSECEIDSDKTGKLRITERFEWGGRDHSAGVNIFSEI